MNLGDTNIQITNLDSGLAPPWASFLKKCIFFLLMHLLLLVVLGLHCCSRAFSSCGERGFLVAVAHLAAQTTGSRHTDVSAVVARGLSSSAAHGIFLNQRSNLCSLYWQVDSYSLCHQGSPSLIFFLSLETTLLLFFHPHDEKCGPYTPHSPS